MERERENDEEDPQARVIYLDDEHDTGTTQREARCLQTAARQVPASRSHTHRVERSCSSAHPVSGDPGFSPTGHESRLVRKSHGSDALSGIERACPNETVPAGPARIGTSSLVLVISRTSVRVRRCRGLLEHAGTLVTAW